MVIIKWIFFFTYIWLVGWLDGRFFFVQLNTQIALHNWRRLKKIFNRSIYVVLDYNHHIYLITIDNGETKKIITDWLSHIYLDYHWKKNIQSIYNYLFMIKKRVVLVSNAQSLWQNFFFVVHKHSLKFTNQMMMMMDVLRICKTSQI